MRRLIIFMLVLFCANVAYAEIETYTGVGKYYIESEVDTLAHAKEQAEIYAERDALEQAAVLVESFSEVRNFKLTKDEIVKIAAGILYVKDVRHEIIVEFDGGLVVMATVTAEIDADKIEELLQREIGRRAAER